MGEEKNREKFTLETDYIVEINTEKNNFLSCTNRMALIYKESKSNKNIYPEPSTPCQFISPGYLGSQVTK